MYRATSALGFEAGQLRVEEGKESDLPVNEADLIVVGRVHVQGSGDHGLEGSVQLDPGVVAHRRVAGEMLEGLTQQSGGLAQQGESAHVASQW